MSQKIEPKNTKDASTGEMTGEFRADETPAPGDMTCDFPSAMQTSEPTPGDMTCELPSAMPTTSPVRADVTCDFPSSVPTESPGTCDFGPSERFGTVDFHVPTEAIPGNARRPEQPTDATCDFSVASPRPATVQGGGAGDKTQPAAPDSAATTSAPVRAGRYVFKRFHAKGGIGEVWLAEDSDLGRPVALKRLLKGRENIAEQFIKEARITGQLEHPGVIPVHELGLDDNEKPFYIMKFVHGQTLKEVIEAYHKDKSPRAWRQLLDIFVDLCQTIAYAHSRGVIHRDIKPDNVMVGAFGETLVLDWGLAKVISEPEDVDADATLQFSGADTAASLAGSIKGTPTYFAPEVAAGKVDEVDQVSDVYLLGATLYAIITGRPPREGKNIVQLLELARKTPPVPPREFDPTVPKPLDAICRKALAHKKEDRYQSAMALVEDMEFYKAGEPVSAYRENLLERTWRFVKKHRTALGRAAALIVIGIVSVTAFVLIREADARRATAQAQADKLKGEDDARGQIRDFKARAEEARFFTASANPVSEALPGLDASQGEIKAAEALKIADAWGPDLENMPLEGERAGLKADLYNLLLELAQLKVAQDAKKAQEILARAAALQSPTRSLYRLRAVTFRDQGIPAQADADFAKAKDRATPTTAMDHYLLGEESRVESLKQTRDNAIENKRAGIKALHARRDALLEAVRHYRQALRLDPDHYWSHYQLAQSYFGLASLPEAAEAYSACVALRPNSAWGYSSRAIVLALIPGREADAEADMDIALKLDPNFRPVKLHRATFYWRQKRYKEADAAFAEILPPVDPAPMRQVYLARGQMYLDRKMYKQAAADFEMLTTGDHPLRPAFLFLARSYFFQDEIVGSKEGLKCLESFVKSDMRNDDAADFHERMSNELGRIASEFPREAKFRLDAMYELQVGELNKAVAAGGKSASIYDELGGLFEKISETRPKQAAELQKQAIDSYTLGIKRSPTSEGIFIKRGWAYANLNENRKAREDFARAVELAPTNAEAHTGLGYTQALLRDPVAARLHANLALLHGGQNYLVLHNVACIYCALTQAEATRATEYEDMAIAQLQRAMELWRLGGMTGPDERHYIRVEPAFKSMRARPDFKKLLETNP